MAFIDPEFYQGSPLQEEVDERVAAEEVVQEVVDKSCPVGQHWDEGLQRCVDDEPADDRPPMPSSEGLTGTQHWVWLEVAKRWDIAGVAQGEDEDLEEEDEDSQLRSDYENLSTRFQELLAGQEELKQLNAESVYDIVYDLFVVQLGLPVSLVDDVEQMLIDGASDLAVSQEIRKTQEYKDRFPVMAERAALGLPRLSEGEVLKLERAYRSTLRQAGLGEEYYDEASDFTAWLVGDVSEAELQTRIGVADAAVRTANIETRQQLADFYNITDTDLLAYYLDPAKAKDIFEARLQLEAAGISAASVRATGAALTVGTAEALREAGVQAGDVQQRLSRRAGLTEELIGSEALTADVLAAGEFGTDLEATTALRRTGEARSAAFRQAGGPLMDRSGIRGLGKAT